MDTIIRNARIKDGEDQSTVDIGIGAGRIAAIEPSLAADGEEIDAGGRFVSPGFIETHIHLDKSCILDRTWSEKGDLGSAIKRVAKVKSTFTPEDVRARAIKTLEKCILNGTTHMRTQLEEYVYEVVVRYDDGRFTRIETSDISELSLGATVRVYQNRIELYDRQ